MSLSNLLRLLGIRIPILVIFIDRFVVMVLINRVCAQLVPVAKTSPGSGLIFIELIDFLKGQSLGLINHGVHKHQRNPAETTPDPENIRLGWIKRSSEVWRDERQKPIEEPIGRCGHGQTLCTSLKREYFSRDNPSTWTKCRSFFRH